MTEENANVVDDTQKEILNNLLNDNPTVKRILKEKGLCANDNCDVNQIIEKANAFTNTAQLWTQINNNLNQQSANNNEENAFIKDIRDRYNTVMDDIKNFPTVKESDNNNNYADRTEEEKKLREMSSERIRLNNSEKIRLMVWGVATVGIFLITFNKLRK